MTDGRLQPRNDDEARRQIREALDATMFVEAGAGTGKTRALVDRVVALVLNGTRIERIAAITFTEKAATELKDRVRSSLEQALREHPEQRDVLRGALGSLDRAQISTIHSFGQALLRTFAPEAEIDPSFTIVDEVAEERRFQERWRVYLESLASDDDAGRVIDRALGLGMTPSDLEALARGLSERAELVSVLVQRPLRAPAVIWPHLETILHQLEGLGATGVEETDNLRIKIEGLTVLVRDLLNIQGDREAILASRLPGEMKLHNVGRAERWGGADRIAEARKAADKAFAGLRDTLTACRREALAGVMPLITRFVQTDATSRGRTGELTFGDLILRTRDLLRENRDAVASLRERYDALLIDEFQDTDPLQVEIALFFARHPESERLEPGRLFLVGDPKQSIYRFRRADMGIYSEVRSLIDREGGAAPRLSWNHRSLPEVLDWVNKVFERLIGPGDVRSVQPDYQPIHSLRSAIIGGPPVSLFGGAVADGRNARELRVAEATDAAAVCRAVVAEEWDVQDPADGTIRPAKYRDVALLMPTRNVLVALERALANAGVPYRVEGGSLVYRTQEVRDLINLLAAADDAADEVAVVAALRSPAFACSDVELVEHRLAGGHLDYHRDQSRGAPRVNEALGTLARYHQERHQTSLAAFVDRLVTERGLVETGILFHGDRNSFRRMRFVVEQARAFESGGPESLRQFVMWLERRSDREILDNEGAGLDDDEDAVRLMTIHAAKGLEFPIVMMLGMAHAPRNLSEAYLSDARAGTVAVAIGTRDRRFQLGPYDDLRDAEASHRNAEFVRNLYVAATRARDHLILSLYRKGDGWDTAAGRIESAGGVEGVTRLAPKPFGSTRRTGLEELVVDEPVEPSQGAFETARLTLIAGARGRVFTSATAEVRETKDTGSEKRDEGDAGEPWARGRGGTRLGRAVHAAIQSLPLNADSGLIQAFSRGQSVAEAIPNRAGDVARLVRQALSSEAAARARSADRALREVPFAVQSGDLTLEGFADMVIETDSGLEIVDWKTDQIGAGEIESRLQDYLLQAGLYVWGLRTATGRPVHRVTYVFVSAGREISPGDPSTLAEMAQRHLAHRIGSSSGR